MKRKSAQDAKIQKKDAAEKIKQIQSEAGLSPAHKVQRKRA